jgi:hypothetical protein
MANSSDNRPRVTLRFTENDELAFACGILIYEQGTPYAISEDGALASLPANAKIALDGLLLEQQPDDAEGFPVFLYRGTGLLRLSKPHKAG